MNILNRIEEIILDNDCYLSEEEILDILREDDEVPSIRNFIRYMDILESTGKIIIDRQREDFDIVIYVGADNPLLENLLDESVVV